MKFSTEQESINYVVDELQDRGWTCNPTQATNKYSYFDIDGVVKGNNYRIEVKRRDMDADKYGDTIIEGYKVNKFNQAIKDNEIKRGYLITLFNDCWTVSDISNPMYSSVKQAQHTTEFDDNRIVDKQFVHYGQHKRFEYKR